MSATNREPVGARTVPSGDAIRSADEAMAKTARGECLQCERLADGEDGLCVFCRRGEEQ